MPQRGKISSSAVPEGCVRISGDRPIRGSPADPNPAAAGSARRPAASGRHQAGTLQASRNGPAAILTRVKPGGASVPAWPPPPGLFSRSSAGRLPAPGICRRNRFRNVLRLKIPAGQAPCPARRFHAAAIAWRRRRIAANRRGAARSGRGEQGAASLRLTPQSISTTEYSGESTPLRAMKRHGARTRR